MNWKRLAIFCLSLLAVHAPNTSTQACGWSEEGEYYFKFFSPEVFGNPAYGPFNFTFDRLYSYDWIDGGEQMDNMADWRAYLRNFPSQEELTDIIYLTSYDDLEQIEQFALGKRPHLATAALENNSVVRLWKQNSDRDMLAYLKLAKRCEYFVNMESDEAYDAPVIPDEDREQLTLEMKGAMKQTKSEFLKLRYAFQIVRLAHYAGDHKAALALYDELVAPNKAQSIIQDWCLSLRAGALRRTGREAEAAYYFSQVFDRCPSKRPQAFQSFVITSDKNWIKAMGMCQNNHEKAIMHAIRAIRPDAKAMEDVREVYALDPQAEVLDLLLVREINKLESDLFGYQFANGKPIYAGYFGFKDSDIASRSAELSEFVANAVSERKLHSPELWSMAAGYLDFLNGRYDQATTTLQKMFEDAGKDPAKSAGAKLLTFVVNCSRTEKADFASENALLAEFQALKPMLDEERANRAFEFMENVLTRLYHQQGQPAKYLLAGHLTGALFEQPSHPLIIDLQSWMAQKQKSDYEKILMKRLEDEVGNESLYELRGTLYLSTGDFEKAIAEFEKMSSAGLTKLGTDPFVYTTTNFIQCWEGEGEPECNVNKYDKLTIARMLKKFRDDAKTSPEKAGMNYFLIGNAYYNMSYFGRSWDALDYYRSVYSWTEKQASAQLYPENAWNGVDHTNLDVAQQYLEMALAKATDRELKAMIIFSLAKIEQKGYYTSKEFDYQMLPSAYGYDKWFTRLKDEYRDTEYYQQAMQECMYFDRFVRARK